MSNRRRGLILAATAIVLLAVLPVVFDRLKAGASVLEAFGVSVPRPFSPDPAPETSVVAGVTGRLYANRDLPAVVLVPGATPHGLEDVRVNAVARSLARSGRAVFIPELDLYREQFAVEDLEAIVAAVEGLSELSGRPVTVVGFSYGGSFALVAAADPRLEGRVSRVATLGAYFDLVGVIQAVTTGGSIVGDRYIAWERPPIAEEFLAERTTELLPEEQQAPLMAALEGRLDPGDLPTEARSLYDLLSNDDPRLTAELVDRLPPALRRLVEQFSPSEVVDRIGVPVLAMHSTDDPVVPYAELVRLEQHMPQAETLSVRLFRHVDFNPASPADWRAALPDLFRVWSFTAWVLAG